MTVKILLTGPFSSVRSQMDVEIGLPAKSGGALRTHEWAMASFKIKDTKSEIMSVRGNPFLIFHGHKSDAIQY